MEMADSADQSAMISVKNAVKSYGDFPVLVGLNLSVQPGTIYGLLGPSGCGKTTLVNAIVGCSELDSGTIISSLSGPKDLGFMPQEISLHQALSIAEIMTFYGYLYSMTRDEIDRRSRHLLEIIDLPPLDSIVSNLSGGQQRRVSLAVALLHDPKLLILDEPTVGLDPVLSKSLWNRLKAMSTEGKTIILTTHYIEEARQASTIGLMRNGRMLTQDTPEALLRKYNTEYLEDVFLELCYNDTGPALTKASLQKKTKEFRSNNFEKGKRISLPRVKAQVWKNLAVAKRNFVMTIFSLLLPLVMDICTNLACGREPYYLPLAIINREFDNSLQRCPTTFTNSCILENHGTLASCVFVNELRERDYVLAEYSDYESALKDHRKKRNKGIVIFRPNFTRALSESTLLGPISNNAASREVLRVASTIEATLDATEFTIHNRVMEDLTDALKDMLHKTVDSCVKLVKPGALEPSLQFQDPVYGDKDWGFYVYFMLGFNIVNILFSSLLFSSSTMLDEKQQGSLDRVLCTGATMWEILISHIMVHSCVALLHSLELYILTYHFLDQPLVGSPSLLFTTLFITALSGMLLGLSVGLLTDHLITAVNAAAGMNFAFVCVTGILWPIEGAHDSIRGILPFMPVTSTIVVVREIALKGHGLSNKEVIKGLAQSIFWLFAAFVFVIMIIVTRRGAWNK